MNNKPFRQMRLLALDRDKACKQCGSTDDLVVHHKDRSGQTLMPNNDIENLITLCRLCHGKHHAQDNMDYTGKTDKELYYAIV